MSSCCSPWWTICKARVGDDEHGKGARVPSQAVVIAIMAGAA